jgi:polar amino acid transport system substrate-binding protein
LKKQFALMMILVLVLSAFVMGCSSGSVDGEGDNNGNQSEEEDLSLEKIKDAGVFIVGLDDSFAPMGFRDEAGKLVGFDIDLAKATIEKLGVEAEFKPIDWNSKELSLETGEIDCIWNGFSITPAREKEVLFSKPYLSNRQIIIVLADSDITSKEDFADRVVGAQINSSGLHALEADTAVMEVLKEIKEYDTYPEAFLDMEAGRIEAIVVDEVYGKYYISKKPGTYKVLDDDFGTEDYGIGFRMKDKALKAEIDKIMDELKADGTTAKISEEWFGEDIVLK